MNKERIMKTKKEKREDKGERKKMEEAEKHKNEWEKENLWVMRIIYKKKEEKFEK